MYMHVHVHVSCLLVWLSMQRNATRSNMSFMWCCTYVAMQYVAIAFFKRNQFHITHECKFESKQKKSSWCVHALLGITNGGGSASASASASVLQSQRNCMCRERESKKEYLF